MANLAVAGLMVAGGLLQFFPLGVQSSIVGSYVILFGAGMCDLWMSTGRGIIKK